MGPKVRGSTGFCLNGYKVTVSDSKMIAGVEEKSGVWRSGILRTWGCFTNECGIPSIGVVVRPFSGEKERTSRM